MSRIDPLLEERRRASALLHDHVGQLLTASLINIEVGWVAVGEDAALRKEVVRDLRDALARVRDLSLALSNPPDGLE